MQSELAVKEKKDIKENLEKFVSRNYKHFCTDGAQAYKCIGNEGYKTHITGNHNGYFAEKHMREEVFADGTILRYKAHSNTVEGAVACFKKALRLCRCIKDDMF